MLQNINEEGKFDIFKGLQLGAVFVFESEAGNAVTVNDEKHPKMLYEFFSILLVL